MKKNKVLLDLERLRYPNSGIANVFRNLAIGLMELSDDSNSNISFFAAKNTLLDIDSKYPVLLRKDIHKVFSFYSKSYDILHTSHQLSSFFHSKRKGQKKL